MTTRIQKISSFLLILVLVCAGIELPMPKVAHAAPTIVTFTTTGTTSWTVPAYVTSVDYLVVAGGGGGGFNGGGAGGMRTGTLSVTPGASLTVTVGAGGAGTSGAAPGSNGSDSVFGSITSIGGGGGGGTTGGNSPGNGGSGGGGYNEAGGTGTAGQGNNGGTVPLSSYGAGGGGAGATPTGGAAGVNGQPGGAGLASSISGSSVTYAGGGGGGSNFAGGTATGGGGAGETGAGGAGSGTANTGGGGGGNFNSNPAGSGGSGIVIISYSNPTRTIRLFGSVVGAITTTYLTSGTSWTVPSNWNSSNNTIEVIGGGGGGGNALNHGGGGGGGGSGGYSQVSNLSLTSGATVAYAVGSGGSATNAGGATYFCNSTSNCASIAGTAVQIGANGGGGGVSASTGTGGSGGSATGAVGTVKIAGSNGGTGTSCGTCGGGGGAGAPGSHGAGAAGTSLGANSYGAAGGTGDNGFGGAGGAQTGYGLAGNPGGSGTEWDASHGSGGGGAGGGGNNEAPQVGTGGAGGSYGAGAGGGGDNYGAGSPAGGAGTQGLIVIKYAVPVRTLRIIGSGVSSVPVNRTAKTVTGNGNAQIDTAQSKFGGASALFDGTGDYLSVPDSADFAFGTGDWTIDFWIRRAETGTAQHNLFGQGNSGLTTGYQYGKIAPTTSNVQFAMNDDTYTASAGAITDTNWHHYAAVRNGNNLMVALDGVFGSPVDITGITYTDVPELFAISQLGEYSAGSRHNGWLDEFRISKGIARWTANFTPPTSAYNTNDTYTKLLLHADGTDAATTFTDDVSETFAPNRSFILYH